MLRQASHDEMPPAGTSTASDKCAKDWELCYMHLTCYTTIPVYVVGGCLELTPSFWRQRRRRKGWVLVGQWTAGSGPPVDRWTRTEQTDCHQGWAHSTVERESRERERAGRVNTQEIDVPKSRWRFVDISCWNSFQYPVQCVQFHVCLVPGLFVSCKESRDSLHSSQPWKVIFSLHLKQSPGRRIASRCLS